MFYLCIIWFTLHNKLLLGFVNRFFQLSFWVPLSRLSFSIYLIHTMVLLYFNSMMEHTFHLQDTTIVNINFISFDLYLDWLNWYLLSIFIADICFCFKSRVFYLCCLCGLNVLGSAANKPRKVHIWSTLDNSINFQNFYRQFFNQFYPLSQFFN